MFDTDVFVLGGGPAGLAAAIAARLSGFHVLLVDSEIPPIDKACGEGLMPDSLHAAAELGISIPLSAGHAFRGIRFQSSEYHVGGGFSKWNRSRRAQEGPAAATRGNCSASGRGVDVTHSGMGHCQRQRFDWNRTSARAVDYWGG